MTVAAPRKKKTTKRPRGTAPRYVGTGSTVPDGRRTIKFAMGPFVYVYEPGAHPATTVDAVLRLARHRKRQDQADAHAWAARDLDLYEVYQLCAKCQAGAGEGSTVCPACGAKLRLWPRARRARTGAPKVGPGARLFKADELIAAMARLKRGGGNGKGGKRRTRVDALAAAVTKLTR